MTDFNTTWPLASLAFGNVMPAHRAGVRVCAGVRPSLSSSYSSLFPTLLPALVLTVLLSPWLTQPTLAADYYWDPNGATAGAGTTPTGTWDTTTLNWGDSLGTVTSSAQTTTTADTAYFVAAPTDGSGNIAYTVTVTGTQSIGTISMQSSGPATFTAGTININSAINIPQYAYVSTNNGAVTISSAVTLASPNTWTNNSASLFSVGGNIANGANLLTVDGSGNTTISGILGGATGGLTKTGAGTLTLSNANTYTGNTTISGGTLTLGASGSINNSPVINIAATKTFNVSAVSGGYALASGQTLKGTGIVTGALTVASGSTISPGNSPGTLFTDNETWAGGGHYLWEIDDVLTPDSLPGVDPGWDFLSISGTLAITATGGVGDKMIIDITGLLHSSHAVGAVAGWSPANNRSFIIATATTISGFDATDFSLVDTNFKNNNAYYDATSHWSIAQYGNSVVLTYDTPEPSALALLALGGRRS